jgi:uncharacterized protein (TIGR03437 family)
MGKTQPALTDGTVVLGPDYPRPTAQVAANLDNSAVLYKGSVAYLGPLPNCIAGAMQANITIPSTLPPGASTLFLAPVSATGSATAVQTIYALSDPPILTGTSPASPISETRGQG